MPPHAIRLWAALVLIMIVPQASAMDAASPPRTASADALAQAASPQAIADYRRLLRQYQEARGAFEEEAGAYWNSIAEKRRGRNAKRREHLAIALDDYVLTQPPVYTGPKRPVVLVRTNLSISTSSASVKPKYAFPTGTSSSPAGVVVQTPNV